MLVVTPLSPAAVDYYFRGQGAGRWVGHGSAALGLAGEVRRRHLGRVLQGCDPADGRFMPARKPARRRAGWDLTLAAPKSLSLLAALASAGDQVAAAHRAAVDEVVDDLERRLLSVMRSAVPGGLAPTVGAVAASFEHLGNGAGEPHLHSHLLLCNLGRDDRGRWSSLSSTWWTERRGLGAVYQLGLRYHLHALGLELDWRLRGDGLADIAGVPRTAVRSTSGRSRAAAADRGAFRHQVDGRTSGIRAAGTIRTRATSPPPSWLERATAAGFGPAEADRLMDRRQHRSAHRRPASIDLDRAVTVWLMSRRSSFRGADVLVALAACASRGAVSPTGGSLGRAVLPIQPSLAAGVLHYRPVDDRAGAGRRSAAGRKGRTQAPGQLQSSRPRAPVAPYAGCSRAESPCRFLRLRLDGPTCWRTPRSSPPARQSGRRRDWTWPWRRPALRPSCGGGS